MVDDDQSKAKEESSESIPDVSEARDGILDDGMAGLLLSPIMMASRSSVGASPRAWFCWSMSSSWFAERLELLYVCRVESIEEVVGLPRIVSGDLGGRKKDDAEMGGATFVALSRSRDAAAADRVAS